VGGTKEARALLLQPDLRVLGSTYGQELRQAMRARDGAHTVLVAPRWKKEMEGIDSIVISGEFPVGVLRHGKRIVLLNAQPDDTDRLAEFLKGKDVLVVVGGMGDWRLKRFWEQWLKENENPQIRSMVIQHAADYIPEWPRFLFETEEAS